MNDKMDLTLTIEEKVRSLKDGTENQKDPRKRREIVKTILIVFLAVMLVLTFFSNTIMNRSLAEISTEAARSGKLTERIRGSGLVESNQSYEVKVEGNRTVDTIFVKTGQEIEADTVLFTVGTGDSPELADAETVLAALELEYQKALCTLPADYSAENQAISNAREDYNDAVSKLNDAIANQEYYQSAQSQYNADKTALTQKTAEQTKLQSTISAIDNDDYSMAAAEYTGNLVSLYNAYADAESEYSTAYGLYMQLSSEGGDTSAAKTDSDEKEAARDSAKTAYDSEKSAVRTDLAGRLAQVEGEISVLSADVSAYENGQLSGDTAVSIDALSDDVEAKQRILEDLVIALEKTKKENGVSEKIANLDLEAKKAEIEKQKAKVEKLKKNCETTEIKSKYSGVVTAINIKPGEMTVPDTPLAVIDISAEGYKVRVSVDGEKANQVKEGVSAEVVNNWGGDVTAVLCDIKNDTVSGSDNRILEFDVTGNVDSGTYLDLSIPLSSGEYQVIVPKSAVYEDKNGKFVLIVKSKSSPLGNRYFAERISVDVIVSDETSCAVSAGELNAGDYVITAASKPVSPGDQVRMKD